MERRRIEYVWCDRTIRLNQLSICASRTRYDDRSAPGRRDDPRSVQKASMRLRLTMMGRLTMSDEGTHRDCIETGSVIVPLVRYGDQMRAKLP